MGAISLLGMLGFFSYEDIRWKRIGVMAVLSFGLLGFALNLFFPIHSAAEIIGGIAIGLVVFVVSILSNESIGKGDALILMVSGVYLGFWTNLILLWGAGTISGLVGFYYFIKGRRKMTLPFVPFLLITYIAILITETFVSI